LLGIEGLARIVMAVFIDTFVNKIDRKGRVSVPATFRAALAAQVSQVAFQGIVAMPSFKFPALHCAGMDWMTALIDSTANVDLFSAEHDELTMSMFPDTKQLPFDGEGRVLLPESLCAHAKLSETAAFAGRGRYFEIWEPRALEEYKAEARKRAAEQQRTLRQASAPAQGGNRGPPRRAKTPRRIARSC
jgi:MraZ protein